MPKHDVQTSPQHASTRPRQIPHIPEKQCLKYAPYLIGLSFQAKYVSTPLRTPGGYRHVLPRSLSGPGRPLAH